MSLCGFEDEKEEVKKDEPEPAIPPQLLLHQNQANEEENYTVN